MQEHDTMKAKLRHRITHFYAHRKLYEYAMLFNEYQNAKRTKLKSSPRSIHLARR